MSEAQSQRAVERRAHPRVPLATRIEGVSEGRAFIALTADISGSGIFLYTANPFAVGDRVQLSFVLPGSSEPMRLSAVVRRVAEGKGMGLQYDSIPPADLAAIRAFVKANS
jgi:uncharacterized protein (TIGR02266 family)